MICRMMLKIMVIYIIIKFLKCKFTIHELKYKFLYIVHRIGRTGRSGRTGIATTFINKANDESVLLDLKHLLMEAKQKVPPFLLELCSENEKYLNLGGKAIYVRIYVFFIFFFLKKINYVFIIFQMNVVAVIVVVLVTELPNVLNWKLSKINKHPTSVAVIT